MSSTTQAPGTPGIAPCWTTSQKNGVGTAQSHQSHVWFATIHGIVGEVYYPRVDHPAVKDMGLIVTDGHSFFSEEKIDTDSQVEWLADGVPGFRLTNTCKQGRYVIEKIVLTDPQRHVLLQKTTFKALQGSLSDYHVYVLLTPHLGNEGEGDNASVGDFKGVPMLMADRSNTSLAMACSVPWLGRSAGFVGVSDGWQDLHAHHAMTWHYDAATGGNVSLTGEIDLSAGGEFDLALGFGRTTSDAGHRARASLNHGFNAARKLYESQWAAWHKGLRPLKSDKKANSDAYSVSTTVLAVHESKDFPGGTIASLSFPWGEIHGDADEGGYHLAWPRDAYETASALLAAGAWDEVLHGLEFFQATQDADGHWPQNMWLDGTGFWTGVQLDEAAAPVLLLGLARHEKKMDASELKRFWPMARQAVGYIVRHGPSSPMDRWEEDAGLTAFTLSTMIAALLITAEIAIESGEPDLGKYLLETADAWNDAIERWTYVKDTRLSRKVGVSGYYVRIAPPGRLSGTTPLTQETIKIPNLDGDNEFAADEIVSVDALALVRFGLRDAKDPRILNTLRVIDAVLKVDTPHGPSWHRYNHDGYGEKADGSPFDKTGIGRIWPLFAGERGHYELAAGNKKEARHLLGVLESLAGDTGLISEQVWDSPPMCEKHLYPGHPSGSARPLVWAHAEHVKLVRSLADGAVFDTPPQTVKRYLVQKTKSTHRPWRFEGKVVDVPQGMILRIETAEPARVRWTSDDWLTEHNTDSRDSGIGLFVADLPTAALAVGTVIVFTFFWPGAARWEEINFRVNVGAKQNAVADLA